MTEAEAQSLNDAIALFGGNRTRLKIRIVRSIPFQDGEQLVEFQASFLDFENTDVGHAKVIRELADILAITSTSQGRSLNDEEF